MKLPWDQVQPGARRALWCHLLWGLGVALADTFVNVYLFRLSRGLKPVFIFQMARNAAVPVGFWLATVLARRRSSAWAYRSGILAYEAFYLVVLLLGRHCLAWLAPLGALLGLAMGAYWLGWWLLVLDLSGDRERDSLTGSAMLGISLAGIAGAPLAGWLVSRFPGVRGYFWLFLLASLIFLAGIAVSWPLAGGPPLGAGGLKRFWRVRHSRAFKHLLWANYLSGIRDGVVTFLAGLLVFDLTRDEVNLGAYAAACGAAGLAGAWMAARAVRPSNRVPSLFLGALGIGLGTWVLALHVGLGNLWVYGLGVALLTPLFSVPLSTAQLKVISESRRLMRRRPDTLTTREVPVALGRVSGNLLLFLFVATAASPALRLIFAGVGLLPLFIALLIRSSLAREPGRGPARAA